MNEYTGREQEIYCESLEIASKLIDQYNYDKWVTKSDKKGLWIGYREEKLPNPKGKLDKLYTVRSEIVINADPQSVHKAIMDFKEVYQFDEYLKEHEIIEDFGETGRIIRLIWKGLFGVISERETVSLTGSFTFSNGVIVSYARSVDHPECPV